jgi:CheY-like chemotaxis protein
MVLVIDDNASVRSALRDLFESVGLRATIFESVREFPRSGRLFALSTRKYFRTYSPSVGVNGSLQTLQ